MAIFPVSPTVGQEETVLGRTFVYDGYGWVVKVSGGHTILDPAGDTMPTQDALQFGNGLSVTDNTIDGSTQIKLGGNITEDLYITSAGNNFVFIDNTYLGGIAGFGMLGATPVLGFSDYIGLINITSDNTDSLLGVNRTDGRVIVSTKSNIQDSISSITLSSGESTIIYYDEETGHCRIALSNSGITVQDTLSDSGMKYERDYSANFTDRSLVDKGYVDSAIIAGSGHVIKDAAGTDMPTQPALQFGAGFTVADETGKTVVGNTAASHIDGAAEEKHTTNQIIQELELLKLNLPANSPLHTILESIDNFLAGTLNTDEIDDAGWAISERRLAILENTINGIQIQGAALLLDIFAPPGVEASLRDNSGWVNETKTLTGDNSTGQLGQKGAMIWLNDAVFAQCVSAVLEVSGSATYKRNRAVDVLDPVNNTQDAAIANELDPSYTYPAMTPTGNSTDDGWNLTGQVKVITGKPTRWGMWFIGGMNGDGYTYHCFLVSGTTSYWKRTGMPSSISRVIYAATHPNLTTNLLAHDFDTGAYTQVSGDEVTYADQTFYDATTRAYFIKMINGNWEKIR